MRSVGYLRNSLRNIFKYLILIQFISFLNAERVEILMSNVTTQQEDAYLCVSYKLTEDQNYITNVEPLATADIAHHMFAFGCEKPASSVNSWNCGSFVCQGTKTILFAWGRNAPAMQLPDDVAFKVGKDTMYKYIVVNIHYLIKVENDRSGLALTVSNKPRRYQAGIMLLVAGYIAVPPNTKKYSTDLSCKYTGKTLQVFAYRVHAHMHGDVNSAFRIRNHEWIQLAKGDPQWPQAFYPADNQADLKDGDVLVGRCTYHNDDNKIIYAGSTHNDEMCNIYLMYYTDNIDGVMDVCSGNSYPQLESIIPADSERKPTPPAYFTQKSGENSKNDALSHHDMEVTKYTYIENWYDNKEIDLGQIGGISVNQKTDNLVIFHRANQIWQEDTFNRDFHFNTRKYSIIPSDTIVVVNRNTGKLVKSWGANMFFMPHGMTIDNNGNIWVTDVGRHQVLKFSPNNTKEPILEVGERMIPGNDKTHFCQPADVAVLRNGDFFVADGYCNSRIVKFNKYGEYITEWSSEDEKMPSHFFVPHSLALHETQSLLCVADRENYRIQCFDLNGNNLLQISSTDFGPIYGVSFAANNASILYAINGFNSRKEEQYDKKIFLISTKTGEVTGSINLNPDALTPHDLALSDDASEIYIADLKPAAVFKYVLVNYKLGTRKNNSKDSVINKDKVNPDNENFRTSMFIMAFLAIPLILVVAIALCVRLKNMGKLRNITLAGVGNGIDSKHKELGEWISKTTNKKKRNGFTRLNQDSENEETVHLNKKNGTNKINTDSDSDSETEIQLPTISKA